MTCRQHLEFFSRVFLKINNEVEIESLMATLNLDQKQPSKNLSGGNQRKLSFGISFLNNARIILLDEPISNLDPISRNQIHSLILKFKGQKLTCYGTHFLARTEHLRDKISIMIQGVILLLNHLNIYLKNLVQNGELK
jgi:ABC-2 type transport system ATP-binding protein